MNTLTDSSVMHDTFNDRPTVRPEIVNYYTKLERLARFCEEYGNVRRATVVNGESETDGAHALRLAIMAPALANEFYPHLDPYKIAAYAIIHDALERYVGDTQTLGASPEIIQAKHMRELTAQKMLIDEFADDFPEFVQLITDYERLADSEARFVKCVDKIDPSFTHSDNSGYVLQDIYSLCTLEEFLAAVDTTTERMQAYCGEFPELMEIREQSIRRVAEQTYNGELQLPLWSASVS